MRRWELWVDGVRGTVTHRGTKLRGHGTRWYPVVPLTEMGSISKGSADISGDPATQVLAWVWKRVVC